MNRSNRRRFLRTFGAAGAVLAAAWTKLVPEANAQTSYGGPAYGGTVPAAPAYGGTIYEEPVNIPLTPARTLELTDQAAASPDVRNLLGHLSGPLQEGAPAPAVRTVMQTSVVEGTNFPIFSNGVKAAHIVFTNLSSTAIELAGVVVPLAVAAFPDGTAYLAVSGQMARVPEPDKERALFQMYFPQAAQANKAANAQAGVAAPEAKAPGAAPAQVPAAPPGQAPGAPPAQAPVAPPAPPLRDCDLACVTPCTVAANIWVACAVAVAVCLYAWWAKLIPMPQRLVICGIAVIGACAAWGAFAGACLYCKSGCEDYNNQLRANWPPGTYPAAGG